MRTTRKVVYLTPRHGDAEGVGLVFAAQAGLLRDNGVEALLAPDPASAGIMDRDLVVAAPESMGLLKDARGEKWVYAGGRFELFAGGADLAAWERSGASGALCPSRPMADLVEGIFPDLAVHVVRPWMDPALFRPGRKGARIAWNGGSPAEREFLANVFAARSRRYREVEWVETGGLPLPERAEVLAGSAVYLALGSETGLDPGPLEAWAAGCLVVGVKTLGVGEYAGPANGIWVEPGDMVELADDLELALTLVKNDHLSVRSMVDAGRSSALAYRLERAASELADFVLLQAL